MTNKKPTFDQGSLPSEDFSEKEIYQHPQPPNQGKPLDKEDKKPTGLTEKNEADKTSKEEGLNEANSAGNAGAFEGFENQGRH